MARICTVSAGIVGPGFMGAVHVEALRRLGFVDIRGVVDSTPQQTERAASRLSIPKAYGSLGEMLEDPAIEVVHNCSPNHLHYEVNLAALEAGKHVISEKPLGMNSRETGELLRLARAPGPRRLVTAVGFCYRFYPMVQEMRAMVRRGDLGRIYLVHGSYFQDWMLYATDYNWRVDPELGGRARALGDIGSHWFDLVEYITGMRVASLVTDSAIMLPKRKKPRDVVRTFEMASNYFENIEVATEDLAGVLMVFDTGARGMLAVSQVSAGRKNRLQIEISGSERSVAWSQEEPNVLWIGERGRPNALLLKDPSLLSESARVCAHYPGGHNEGYPDANRNLFAAIYRAVVRSSGSAVDPTDVDPQEPLGLTRALTDYPSFADGHRAVVLVDAAIESATHHRWVELDRDEP